MILWGPTSPWKLLKNSWEETCFPCDLRSWRHTNHDELSTSLRGPVPLDLISSQKAHVFPDSAVVLILWCGTYAMTWYLFCGVILILLAWKTLMEVLYVLLGTVLPGFWCTRKKTAEDPVRETQKHKQSLFNWQMSARLLENILYADLVMNTTGHLLTPLRSLWDILPNISKRLRFSCIPQNLRRQTAPPAPVCGALPVLQRWQGSGLTWGAETTHSAGNGWPHR